jgi:ribosome recycling factor
MIDDALKELAAGIEKAHEALRRELSRLRTGRAHSGLLDSIRVDYYGVSTPLQQMAQVTVPEPRMLVVKPWEKPQLKAIEKAIIEANLGLNPQNDGVIIRLPMPPLTEDRRKDLVKVAKKHLEECKVSIRKCRHEAKDFVEALKEEGEIGEDDMTRGIEKVEDLVRAGQAKADEILERKEKDILEI